MRTLFSSIFKILIPVIIIFSLLKCTDPNAEVIALEEEVIRIHDEVMPKTSDIFQIKKDLQQKLSQNADSVMIFSIIKKLDDADEAMMVWMDQYESPDLNNAKKENLNYLNAQKVKIIEVKDKMLSAIQTANDFKNAN